MLLPWLPDGLTIRGTALVRYALRGLLEAEAWSEIGVRALLHDEQRLRKAWKREQAYLAAANRAPHLPWTSDTGGQLLMHPTEEMSREFTRTDLLKLAWLGLPSDAMSGTRLNHWFRDPGRTLKLAHWSLARTASVHGLGVPSISRALAVAGIGILGLQLNRRCEKCFRLAVPGIDRCGHHSQSSRVAGSDINRRRTNARAATRVLELVGELGQPKDLDLARRLRARQVHGAVFDRPLGDVEAWQVEVLESVHSCPRIKSLLPSTVRSLSPTATIQALRACLDPFERDPSQWPTKIRQADEWLRAEVKVAPGRPPKGPRGVTVERLQRYAELHAQGLESDEIAKRLQMTPGALALMLKRARSR